MRVHQHPRITSNTPNMPTPKPKNQTWPSRSISSEARATHQKQQQADTIDKSTRANAHTYASRLYQHTLHTASNHACPTTRRRGAGRRPFGCLERPRLHPAHARRFAPAAAAAMRVVPLLHRVGKRPDHVSSSKREKARERAGGWTAGVARMYCLCLSCFV